MRDLVTTTPEAAAQHARNTTPALYPERPTLEECVTETGLETTPEVERILRDSRRRMAEITGWEPDPDTYMSPLETP